MSAPTDPPLPPGTLALVRRELDVHAGTVTTADLTGLGCGPQLVRTLLARSVLLRVGRGAFVDAARHRAVDRRARHILTATAIARTWPPDVLVSHTSAALMLGLPLTVNPDRVHGCRRAGGQHRRRSGYTIHTGYADARSSWVNGVEVLEPRFVVMGVAELHGRNQAVVVGDAAVARGHVTLDELRAVAESCTHHPVHATFARAVELIDGRSESAGESRSRLLLVGLGYRVVPQVVIRDARGAFLARVDFLIEGTRVIVEFDGMVKYVTQADLAAEKRRELSLLRAGYTVVRIVWSDLDNPTRVRALLEDALAADRRAS